MPDGNRKSAPVVYGTTVGASWGRPRRRLRVLGVQRVVLVSDRGMLTSRRIDHELRHAQGLDWISALQADSIQKRASAGVIESSLFDQRDLVEVSPPDCRGERLVVYRNPLLADEGARRRRELLDVTQKGFAKMAADIARPQRLLRGKERIGLRVGSQRPTSSEPSTCWPFLHP